MNYKPPIKTVPDISDSQLPKAIKELESQGYMVVQRKRNEVWNHQTQKQKITWTLKAKLNSPPPKAGRILVDD